MVLYLKMSDQHDTESEEGEYANNRRTPSVHFSVRVKSLVGRNS